MIKSFFKRAKLMNHRAEPTGTAAEGERYCQSRCESTRSVVGPLRGPRKVRSCANLVKAKTKTLVRAKSSALLRSRSPCPPPPLPPNTVGAGSKIHLQIFAPADLSVSEDALVCDDRSLSPSRPTDGFLARRICRRLPSIRMLRTNQPSMSPPSTQEAEPEQHEFHPLASPVRNLFSNLPWSPLGPSQSLRKRLMHRKPNDLDDSESDITPSPTADADRPDEETEEDEYSFYSAVMVPLEFPDEESPAVDVSRRPPMARPGWARQPDEQELAKRGSGVVWFGIRY